nr:40S ribosomal protein SA-like [Ipomoea batatas]
MATTARSLSTKEADIQMMLAAEVQLGTKNCDFQMERYVFKRRNDGIYIINLGKTWEKLQMAARVIVAIENPKDIIVQSARPYGQRAVLKFAQYTGANAIAGRHTPGTFTNQLQTSYSEPRLLILTDPRTDHQPIKEAALGNIPTIAFCDTDSPMRYVDICIPANNKGKHSIGVLFWLLARMVQQMRGAVAPGHKWDIMIGYFVVSRVLAIFMKSHILILPLANIPDSHWSGDAAPVPVVTGEWTAETAAVDGGWDAAAPPAVPVPAGVDVVPAATGKCQLMSPSSPPDMGSERTSSDLQKPRALQTASQRWCFPLTSVSFAASTAADRAEDISGVLEPCSVQSKELLLPPSELK